jgi:ABC-type branched-subunit amino acid transport system substrate-binding protein
MTRTRAICLGVAVLALIVGACRPATARPTLAPTASPAAVSPIVIGALVNLGNGDPASRQTFDAMSLAVESINRIGGIELSNGVRRPIRLAAYDDAGSLDRVGPNLRRLADEDQALAVVGPADLDTATISQRLAEHIGVPLVTLTATSPDQADGLRWSFALAAANTAPLAALVDYLAASGVQQVGWLAPQTADASEARAAFTTLTLGAGLRIVGSESYPLGDEGLAARAARLQAAGAQVIVAWPHDTRGAAAVIQQVGPLPNGIPLFLGPAADDPKSLGTGSSTTDGLHTVMPRLGVADDLWDHDALTPVIRDFSRAFRLRFGSAPTDDGAAAWDALRLLASAIGGSAPTRESVRQRLEDTVDLPSVSGIVTFGPGLHNGLDKRAFLVARSAGGRWRLPP